LKRITDDQKIPIPSFDYKQVQKAIMNKAPDAHGITAEHMKYATPSVIGWLTIIILNAIINFKFVPKQMKVGVLTPVFKKKKSKADPYIGESLSLQ
jgi:hypothetical protein